ncbi:hypothetical protein ACFQ44_03170 [Levilactobacillus lanxiensis]|uniref:Uncharacterized protein n=1 Tax=Levilactobacillus lanxiensis TaxID=2799568 RepID=A0ABW4CZK2_9LACO
MLQNTHQLPLVRKIQQERSHTTVTHETYEYNRKLGGGVLAEDG